MAEDLLNRLKEKGVVEAKKLLWIFAYLWVLLGLFALHKSIVLGEASFYHQGFAIINALVLAKIVFVAEELHVADELRDKPLIYPIAYRSAVFSIILLVFHLLEEGLAALWKGKTVMSSIGTQGVLEQLVLAVIMFVVLMPFFALREIARDIGGDELFEQFFVRRRRSVPMQP
ncbi:MULTISPECIES: hypothetical protein [unclassified Bradyrhizobium]|uniref:hypothetical protein n=1 Tax=unclassified Bradyrhizobium TaxID=2631580 RepID=UPI00040E3669|nr:MULTISPECIES: hypothetical protein [unclassified Bradyrhizobium]QIG93635.1 hypothetical protein G6P99_14745 [Bradyrhizobium sp. 6(2017)]